MAGLIPAAFARALSQFDDPRFRRVIRHGVGWTLAALLAAYALVFWGVGALVGEGLTLPWVGTIPWAGALLSWASLVLMMGLSVVLMVPIAQAVQSLFLDEVADAVEARHYPTAPPAHPVPLGVALRDGMGAFGVLIVANIAALALYVLFAPFAPVIFYGLNGFLLGREYFHVAALRRETRADAARLRRRHLPVIWGAGVLMAVPLTIPLVNLTIPVLGTAVFTHLYHGLKQSDARP